MDHTAAQAEVTGRPLVVARQRLLQRSRTTNTARFRTTAERRSALLRTGRWIAVVLLPTFAALHVISDGARALGLALIVSLALSLALVGTNLFSASFADERDVKSLLKISRIELAADSAVALTASWLLLAQPESGGWFILVLPILEGAIRLDRKAAVVSGSVIITAHIVGLFVGANLYDSVSAPSTSVIVTRTAALVIAGWISMAFAEEFEREASMFRRARLEEAHRSQLMEVVIKASGEMDKLTYEHTTAVLMDAAKDLGFTGVAVARSGELGWDVGRLSSMFDEGDEGMRLTMAAASLVSFKKATVLLDDSVLDSVLHRDLELAGQVVAVPVQRHGNIHCVLVLSRLRVADSILGIVELLVNQAAVVLDHVLMFEEAERLRERLAHDAFHDELTGLPNRAEFAKELERTLTRGESEDDGVAVLFIDLDGFKDVNDTHGHAAGDILLEAVGARLRNCVRPEDHVARLGGDEFTVLMRHAENTQAARAVAKRAQAVIAEPYNVNGHRCFVGSSIGIAFSDDPQIDPQTLLKRADAAMYLAKRNGKAQIQIDDGIHLQLNFESWGGTS